MADNINTLLGLGLNSQDDMKALASSLRNEQAIGDYFSTSTTPEWAEYGQGMQKRTTDAATRGGVLRQAMEREATRQKELAAEKARLQENFKSTALAKTLAATTAHGRDQENATLLHDRGQDDINLRNTNTQVNDATKFGREQLQKQETERVAIEKAAELARVNAEKEALQESLEYDDYEEYVTTNGDIELITTKNGESFLQDVEGKIIPTTLHGKKKYVDPSKSRGKKGIQTLYGSPKQQTAFEDRARQSQDQMVIFNQFQDGMGNDTGLPVGGIKSTWTSMGMPSTDNMKERQQWFKDLNDKYVNIKRHDLFGSALTEGEQKAWKAANIHENSTSEQIADSMATYKYLTKKLAYKAKQDAIIKGRDQDYIDLHYGWLDNYGEFTDLSEVPKGVEPSEWEELSYGERQEIIDEGLL